MAPIVGLALGTVTGSVKFFGRSMAGLIIGGILVFHHGGIGRLAWDNFIRSES